MAKPYGEALARLRKKKGWSQGKLAEEAGISRETIIRAEQSGNVGALVLHQIANALDVELVISFGGAPPPVEKPPSVWAKLKREQRANVLRYAYRLVGEAVPSEEIG